MKNEQKNWSELRMKMKAVAPKTTYFAGGKRGVILLHAYTGTPNDVRQLGRYLNKENYSVLMPLLSGHGTDNAETILTASPTDWVYDIEKNIAEMVTEGFSEIAVFGLSLGGVLAFDTLIKRPDVVIGGGSFCSPIVPELKSSIEPTFMKYAAHLLKIRGVDADETEASLARVAAGISKQLNEIESLGQTVYRDLTTIMMPTFLAQAGQDELIEAQQVFETAGNLSKSPFTLNWYPKSGHVITVGPERQQLQEDVLHFLSNLPWTEG